MPKKLTTREYAKELGVSIRTVERWIKAGKINAHKEGRGYKIPALTTKELARKEGVSQRTIQRRIKAGKIKAVKKGRGQVIPRQIPRKKKAPEKPPALTPEEIEFEEEEPEELGIPVEDESRYSYKDLRKSFVTLVEAQNYESEIPVATHIFQRKSDGRFQVVVDGSD